MPEIVKTIITGTANKQQILRRMEGKQGRLPVTPDIMKAIKVGLKASNMTHSRKRTMWLCCTLCWSGAFRIHEILARNTREFDPTSTLLFMDIKETFVNLRGKQLSALKVNIKHPKEERLSAGVIIDVFQVEGEGSWMCPVRAWRDWCKDRVVIPSNTKPAIRLASGANYTGSQFNKDLKKILADTVDYSKGNITAHSFRSGLATWMSKVLVITL